MANTDKAAPRQPHSDQGVLHSVGSPLAAFLDNRTPMGTGDRSNQQQAFQTSLKQCYSDYASGRSGSRKREHTQSRGTAAPTPMQSPAQKNFKVKSTVTLVEPASQPRWRSYSRRQGRASETPTWCPHRRVPYHLIGVREVMGREGQDSEKALSCSTSWTSLRGSTIAQSLMTSEMPLAVKLCSSPDPVWQQLCTLKWPGPEGRNGYFCSSRTC